MDYEQKYKEALERANVAYKDEDRHLKATLERIFPELAESEDERIRKALIEFFGEQCDMSDWNGVYGYQVFAWLEKQGEQKSVDYENINLQPNEFASKVEPKFKVGDWIVDKESKEVFHIEKKLVNTTEIVDVEGNDYHVPNYILEEDYDVWTIQDAKDGDVLVNGSNIFMFHLINGKRLMGYCHVNTDNGKFYNDIGKNECFCLIDAVVKPATKEQRDLLFQKMKEAGYEWNSEKKELKKIEDEEYNGKDYGIDSLWHAKNILEKTLGKVDGYQSDDGILEHKCAISAIKKYYQSSNTEVTTEDRFTNK